MNTLTKHTVRVLYPINLFRWLLSTCVLSTCMCANAQTYDLQFYGELQLAPGGGASISLAGDTVGATNADSQSQSATTPTGTATLEIGKHYVLKMETTGLGVETSDCDGTNTPNSYIRFANPPSGCMALKVSNYDHDCDPQTYWTNYAHISDADMNSGTRTNWDVVILTNTGTVMFESSCNNDGQLIIRPYLENSTLTEPVVWSIQGANRGCSIDSTSGTITVTNSDQFGTLKVRATGEDGCYLDGNFSLGDDSGSCAGGCGEGGLSEQSAESPNGLFGDGVVQLNDGIDVRISLGKSRLGDSAHFLRIHTNTLNSWGTSPSAITYAWAVPDVHVVMGEKEGCTFIQQIKGPQGLATVTLTGDCGDPYTIKFYHSKDVGLPDPILFTVRDGAQPFAQWTIRTNTDNWQSELSITAIQYERNLTNNYRYELIGSDWYLTNSSLLRVERVQNTTNGTTRTETRAVMAIGSSTVLRQASKTYLQMGSGEKIIEEVLGTGEAARTNAYTYYLNPA